MPGQKQRHLAKLNENRVSILVVALKQKWACIICVRMGVLIISSADFNVGHIVLKAISQGQICEKSY